jgi:hypothetical protein
MKECVIDFEKAVWLELKRIFDLDTKIFVCGFHWNQFIFSLSKLLGNY